MITSDIAAAVRRQIADDVEISPVSPNRLELATRFLYLDGDRFSCSIARDGAESPWEMSDEGDVITRASYVGVDLLAGGRRKRLLRTAEFYGIKESNGVLTMAIESENDFGEAFFIFIQGCFEIYRLARFPA